ncbi:MAG TPA: S8 family peptidase [Cyclobacteriaceae bacterium]|nr:S8 family peptidase [Cyclobacteriaceae bacterium]
MRFNKILLILFLILSFQCSWAQDNRYMVFFSDKNGSPFNITSPADFLSAKAIARRSKQNISITESDLPVNPDYCQQLKDAGVPVYYKTRWLNGVLVQCDASMIPTIEALGFVTSVELVAPGALLSGARVKQSNAVNNVANTEAAYTDTQLQMLGMDKMHTDGIHGEGITIAVLDAGFPGVNSSIPFQNLINDGRIDLSVSHDFVLNSTNVFAQNSHGTKVLSTIAALEDPQFFGGAYNANFQLYITEYDPSEYRIEEYNWLFAAERADSAGADIISTSLGYNTFDDATMDYTQTDMDGKTAVISKAAQYVSDKGVLVVCSAGNEGADPWHIITAPADVEDVLAIGNITAQGSKSVSSSVGPTADGRIKPDLVALGTDVSLIAPDGSITLGSGTSFAAPLVAALAAGVWQKYPSLTRSELIFLLKRTASQFNNPDNSLGYGIPNYIALSNYQTTSTQVDLITVFPNPFSSTLQIRPKNPDQVSTCRYQLTTLQGVILDDRNVEFTWLNPAWSVPVSDLAAGLYLLKIRLDTKSYTYKIVKE